MTNARQIFRRFNQHTFAQNCGTAMQEQRRTQARRQNLRITPAVLGRIGRNPRQRGGAMINFLSKRAFQFSDLTTPEAVLLATAHILITTRHYDKRFSNNLQFNVISKSIDVISKRPRLQRRAAVVDVQTQALSCRVINAIEANHLDYGLDRTHPLAPHSLTMAVAVSEQRFWKRCDLNFSLLIQNTTFFSPEAEVQTAAQYGSSRFIGSSGFTTRVRSFKHLCADGRSQLQRNGIRRRRPTSAVSSFSALEPATTWDATFVTPRSVYKIWYRLQGLVKTLDNILKRISFDLEHWNIFNLFNTILQRLSRLSKT